MTILFADNPDNSLKRKKRKVEYEKYQRTRGSVEVRVMNFKSCLCAAEQNIKLSETSLKGTQDFSILTLAIKCSCRRVGFECLFKTVR